MMGSTTSIRVLLARLLFLGAAAFVVSTVQASSWNSKLLKAAFSASTTARRSWSENNKQSAPIGRGGNQELGWDSTIESLLFFTNIERRRCHMNKLTLNTDLTEVAQRHAEDMARHGYLSHTGQMDGSGVGDRIRLLTEYRYDSVGENLFWRSPDNSPDEVVRGWMGSPEHQEKLLNDQFEEIGLGYAVSTRGTAAGPGRRRRGGGEQQQPPQREHYYVQVLARPLETPQIQGHGATVDLLFHLTNLARKHANVRELEWSDELSRAAQMYAEDMAGRGGDASSSVLCDHILHTLTEQYGFRSVAVNFAYRTPFSDPVSQVKDWLDRQDSAGQLYDVDFTQTGLGYSTDGERHYYVQLFGIPLTLGQYYF